MAQARQGKPGKSDDKNASAKRSGSRAAVAENQSQPLLSQSPAGGLPETLRQSMEQMSSVDLSNVQVHYNSEKPKALGALAYAEGDQIYLAPGEAELLPHEAWHLIQQAQGRVSATDERAGHTANTEPDLESEADEMGGRAKQQTLSQALRPLKQRAVGGGSSVAQMAYARIKMIEIFKNSNEVKITLINGTTYTYPLIESSFEEPEPRKQGDPDYKSGQIIKVMHKANHARDEGKKTTGGTTAGTFAYDYSYQGVTGQPGLSQLPASKKDKPYSLIFYLKGSKGDGKGNGKGDGEGDKSGEGTQGKKKKTKGEGENKTGGEGGEKKKTNEQELKDFLTKMGGEGKDTDNTALTDEEKKRAGEALADLTEAEEEHFIKTMESLAQQCEGDEQCKSQGLADLLEFYKNLDEADKEALSINQMLKSDLTSDSDELPEEVLLNIKADATDAAEGLGKAKDINSNMALILRKVIDPALRKEFQDPIKLEQLSEMNNLLMIQGLLAGASERLPEIQPVAIELNKNVGKLRDFILTEIAWLVAEMGATMLLSSLLAPVSGGASVALGAAEVGYIALRLNKLRLLIKKINKLVAVINKIEAIIATFKTVKDNLEKADHMLKAFEDKRAEIKKLQDMLRKGEATADQILEMENLEDQLLEMMLGSEDKIGMIDKLEPMMDRFFLPDDLTDEELKGLFYDIPEGIEAVQDMLSYKGAVESGNADQTVTLSLKGFRAGYLMAPFVGFLTDTINEALNSIMDTPGIAERLIGFGGKRGKSKGFKRSKSSPKSRMKGVKSNKTKREDAKKKAAKASKDTDKASDQKKGKKDDKKKKKDDKETSQADKYKIKWKKMEAEINAVGKESKDNGGMTEADANKKIKAIISNSEYTFFKAKMDVDVNPGYNHVTVIDKGKTKLPAKPGGKSTKRKANKKIHMDYLRNDIKRHKLLNAAIRDTFKAWTEDKSDTKEAIQKKLDKLVEKYAYPIRGKDQGKATVEADKPKKSDGVVAWKVMTSVRKGQLAEIVRIKRPGNHWGSKTNPIKLNWEKPAITDNSAKAYKPIYVGPHVASEVQVKQSDLETYYKKKPDERAPLADDIINRLTNPKTKTSVEKWKTDGAEIKKYKATGSEKLPGASKTTLGVISKWQVKNGEEFPFVPTTRANEAGSTITNRLRLFGFFADDEKLDGDHVWEIQLGGPDHVENMWPLDSEVNRQGGTKLANATVTNDENKKLKMSKVKDEARENIKKGKDMWIKVKVP